MRKGLLQSWPQYSSTARRCSSCTHDVVLFGSVSLTEGKCLGCRQRQRQKATAADLKRIHKELTRRAIELNERGFAAASEDWASEARVVGQELSARRERCTHDGIPFGICSACGQDADEATAAQAVHPMPCLGCVEPTCRDCGVNAEVAHV